MPPLSSLDVTFEVVTPAYAGGADRSQTDGLRPPTLKSLFRFWWRAMHPELTGRHLFDEEAKIFGSTVSGQGLRVIPLADPTPTGGERQRTDLRVTNAWEAYMAYGPVTRRNVGGQTGNYTNMERVSAGSYARPFSLRWRNDPAMHSDILCTLWLTSTFGSVGSRGRRGWGSVSVGLSDTDQWPEGLQDLTKSTGQADVTDRINQSLNTLFSSRSGLPARTAVAHSAFTRETRVVVGPAKATWEDAFQSAASVLQTQRQKLGRTFVPAGRPPVTPGADHDLIYDYAKRTIAVADPPLRAAFGLPHPYFLRGMPGGDAQKRFSVTTMAGGNEGRRNSPVIVKILKIAPSPQQTRFLPIVLWLNSMFLPAGHDVYFVRGDGSGNSKMNAVRDFSAISELLTAYVGAGWKEVTW